ncbi:hypothetical protein MOX02_51480 [Methylobacterium oxalidis]|uniref:Uncharacterized protein n=1 Tax=Methylobacterium oxalidis TaxID=944322 RepID=A0A512JAV8_9HYPH|nr:hypothetical protein MOX02_51480 [Methylobacterium oxalidis]GLS66177.1 hypothetical protein GCM10007888_45590 [Methylobacterium oxalidis]
MSCRHQSDEPRAGPIEAIPARSRKWLRWPSELPQPSNDNRRAGMAQAARIAAVGLAGLGGLATLIAGLVA